MNEEEMINIAKQALKDFELAFYENEIPTVEFFKRKEFLAKYRGIESGYLVVVNGPSFQFPDDPDGGGYLFYFEENEPHRIYFTDCSGGQIPPAWVKKDENGKYYRDFILR